MILSYLLSVTATLHSISYLEYVENLMGSLLFFFFTYYIHNRLFDRNTVLICLSNCEDLRNMSMIFPLVIFNLNPV